MGAEAYAYYIDYQPDISAALETLRQREFEAGRYNPVMPFPEVPVRADSPSPGAQHSSIDAVHEAFMEIGDATGTRSILDICYVSDTPFPYENNWASLQTAFLEGKNYRFTTYPLSSDDLLSLFGTDKPTHEMIESVLLSDDQSSEEIVIQFWGNLQRGTCKHIILYDKDKPVEIFFVGFSFD